MPVEETTALLVTCDNPNCPNENNLPRGLAHDDRTGWLLVTLEEYAVGSVSQGIYCSWECVIAGEAPVLQGVPQEPPVDPTVPTEVVQ